MTERKTRKKVGPRGWQCGEYRIGEICFEGCTLFEVWYGHDLIGTKNDRDEAMDVARAHAKASS